MKTHTPLLRLLSGGAATALLLLPQSASLATPLYWDTNGTTAGSGSPTGTWGTNLFWNTDPLGVNNTFQSATLVTDDLFFSAGTSGTTGTVTVTGAQVANSITFDDNVAMTLSGGTSITLGSGASAGTGVFVASGDNAANTISTPMILGATSSTFQNSGSGTLTIGGTLNLGANALTVNGGVITVSGLISGTTTTGTTAVTITGNSTVTLSNAGNTFTGDIAINGANAKLVYSGTTTTTASQLGRGTATNYKQILLSNGGIFNLSAADFNDNVNTATNLAAGVVFNIGTGGGVFDVASTRTLTLDDGTGAGTAVANTQLQGAGTLTKIGAGTLVLGNSAVSNAAFTGQILINAGTLRLGSMTTAGVGLGATSANTVIASGAAFDINNNASTAAEPVTINGTGISSGNVLTSSNAAAGSFAGPLTLGSASTIGAGAAGTITLSGGITGAFNLTISNKAAGGTTLSTTSVNNGGSITNSGAGAGTTTISSVVGTNVTSVVQNSATSGLALSGANTFSGGVTILAGAVTTSGSAAALGTGTVLLGDTSGSSAATLNTGATALTFANPITVRSGSSGLKAIGLTGTAAVSYSGAVTLNAPLTLRVTNTGALTMTGPMNLNSNVLTIANTSTGRVFSDGVISGTGSVEVNSSGAGDYVPRTVHTYTGGTTLTAGFVAVDADSTGSAGSPTAGPFGSGSAPLVLAGAQLRSSTGANRTIGNAVTISADTGFYTATTEKLLTFTGPVTLSGATRTLSSAVGTTVPGASVVFNGAIGDGGNALGLTKAGNGNLTLGAVNTFTGATTVNAGSLILSTTAGLNASSGITVQTGGTLVFNSNHNLTTPLTVVGNATQATSGTVSMLDGAVNSLTAATLNFPDAVNPAYLNLEIGSAGIGDSVAVTNGTYGGGGVKLNLRTLGAGYDGSSIPLITSASADLTTAGISLLSNNIAGYTLSLNTTAASVTLNGVSNGSYTGALYWKGGASALWNGGNASVSTNLTTDAAGTLVSTQLPGSGTDVFLNATGSANQATSLGQDFTINSLNTTATATTTSIAGGGGTLTISPSSTASGVSVVAGTGAITISAPVALGASQTWTNGSANALTISGLVSGGSGNALVISNTAAGGTTLSGANTFTGGVTMNSTGSGLLTITDATNYVGDVNITNNGFGSGPITLTAGTLALRANGDGTTAPQTLTYNNPLTVNGNVTINADYQAAAGGNGKTLAFPTTSIGANTLGVTGGSHGYTLALGNITLNAAAGGATTIGSSSSTIWLTAGNVTGAATTGNTNTLVLGGIIGNANSTISGGITDGLGGGKVALTTNTLAFWSLSGATSNTYTGLTTVSKSGTVAGAGLTLAKTGGAIAIPGDLTIGDGTATQSHVIMAGNDQISPTGTITFNGVNSGWSYLQMRGKSQTIGTVVETNPGFGVIETREGAGTFGSSTVNFNVASGTQSYQGYFRDIGAGTVDLANSLALEKNGGGTLRFGAFNGGTGSAGTSGTAHAYSGGTKINNGTLQMTTLSALPALAGGIGVTLDGGATVAGTLDLNGFNQGINALNGTTGVVLGRIVNDAAATTATLTVGNNNTSGAFAGQLIDNTGVGGVLALVKTGTGTQILSGLNSGATGNTTISGGILQIGSANNLTSGAVVLNGGTLSVLNDSNTTFANAFTMNNATSTINIDQAAGGSGTNGVVSIGSLVRPLTPASGTLNVTGANGYKLVVGSLALPGGTGHDTILNPTTASMVITGNVTNQMAGFATTNFSTLSLSGSSTGNELQGNISDAVGGSFVPLLGGYTRLLKLGAGTWTFSGTGSTYTGITQVQNGSLLAGADGVIPSGNLQGIQLAATGAGISAIYDLNGFDQTLNTAGGVGTAISLSGTTATSTPQLLGAGSTLTINGGVTYSATANPLGGTISVDAMNFGAGTRTFNVGDSTSAAIDLTVSSNLSNGSLIKTGAGVLCLTGALNLSQIQASAGTICVTGTTTINSTPVLVNGGIFDLGATTQNAANFTISSGSIINGSLTTGGSFLKQGPGTLTLGTAVNAGAATAVTINQALVSTTSNPATLSNLNLNFSAAGAPTTFFDNGSTLALGGSANDLVAGGQLTLTGAAAVSNVQTFTSTLVDAGANAATLTAGASGSVVLNLGTLTRNVAGTIDLTLPTGTQSSTNGITVGGTPTAGTLVTSVAGTAFATVGGNDWAAYSTVSPNNLVPASAAGVAGASIYTAASSAATFNGNADVTASFTATGGATVNSLRFNTGTLTLTLSGTNTITTGGILFGNGATGVSTITGGTIQPANGELVIINNKPNVTPLISSVIANNGATPTTVTFRGNPNGGTTGGIIGIAANNTYTGPTYIQSGRVQNITAGITIPFGTGANAIVYIDGNTDGQFFYNQNGTIANPFVIIGTGFNEAGTRRGVIRLDSTAAITPTLSGAITLLGDASIGNNAAISGAGNALISGNIGTSNGQSATSFALTKVMTGVIRLTGTNSQTATNINGGVLNIIADAGLGVAAAPVTFTGASTLQFNNTSAITLSTSRNFILNAAATFDTVPATGNVTIPGVLSGTGSLIKGASSTTAAKPLILTGVNTFTGGVTITQGWLTITNSSGLGTGAKSIAITNGTAGAPQLHLDPAADPLTPSTGIDLPATITFNTSSNTGSIVNDSGDNIVRGAVSPNSGGGGTTVVSNAGSLNLTGNISPIATGRDFRVRGDGALTTSGVISDGSTVQLPVYRDAGTGTWTISGNNTYGGETNLQTGTIKIGSATALGSQLTSLPSTVATGTTVTAGAVLDLNGTSGVNERIILNGTGVSNGGALINSNTGSAATIGSSLSSIGVTNAAGATSTTMTITGGGGTGATATANLGVTAASFTVNNGTTTYSAAPTVAISGGGGTGATATARLGVTTTTFTIAGGTTVYSVAPTVTISGGGGTGATATANLTGGVVTSITITNPGGGFSTAPTIAFSGGTITTAGTNPTGTGNVIFIVSGINITAPGSGFTSSPNVAFSAGTVAVAGTNPTGTGNATNFTINNVTLTNAGSGYTSVPTLTNGTATFSSAVSGVQLATTSSIGGAGDITINGVVSGTGLAGLTKEGAGALTLTNANTYSGPTAINGGALALSGNGSFAPTSSVTMAAGTVFDIQATTAQITKIASLNSTAPTSTVRLGSRTLEFGDAADQTFAGTIENGATAGGSIKKVGTGIVTLSGINTYTGTTMLSGGTLLLGSSGALPGSAKFEFAGNGTTLSVNGNTASTGQLSMALPLGTDVATLDLAGGSSRINFADSSSLDGTWAGLLQIWNWAGNLTGGGDDRIFFGSNDAGLTPDQLAKISFIDPAGMGTGTFGAQLLSNGELVPVPEPAALVGGLLLLATAGVPSPPPGVDPGAG